MFISTAEKEYLKSSVLGLQEEVERLKIRFLYLAEKTKKENPKEAPYGFKKDGTPKQRPGRKPARRRA